MARLRLAVYPVLQIETAAGFDGSRDGLPGALAFFRVQKGKEQFVSEGQVVGYAKKGPGRIGPKQLVRRQIQIPYANAGSFDTQPKALVSDGILGRWMQDGGHDWPSIVDEGLKDTKMTNGRPALWMCLLFDQTLLRVARCLCILRRNHRILDLPQFRSRDGLKVGRSR